MKHKFLKQPTLPIEVYPDKPINKLSEEMLYTGFQGRKLAEITDIWTRMIRKKHLVIWFGLSGAMVPAGMRRIISYFIQRRMIDVLVSTGANLYHDCFEALGKKHFVGSHLMDDNKLRKCRVDRIYDVLANEDKFYQVDLWIEKEFASQLKDNYPYSSREVLYLLGKTLSKVARDKNSILISAYKQNVPIFCPAFGDSSIGFSIMFANRRRGKRIIVDSIKDVNESARITEKAKATGVIYIGGGTPKNFIQQTAVIAGYQTRHDKSHSYAVQITTDSPQWGGLSGCTFEEAQSWGKIGKKAKKAICYCDATIALPFISHVLSEKFKKLRRLVPIFNWVNNTVEIKYEKMRL
ncbi:MAG: deoxyhypusine synthase [Candidatus Parvarchaeota archaeon]|nr:deoxyhypusine synthase [Candidatus Jingweiarchaeum tengchongense]MCW1298323.1 deoxyhypusine synthase [Candidatus Jingweiarchaeum tengchongense]MCW1300414.1 deoxyhypusine synthase [Candidatus Jingweiarchaeum tengchongense]MCW1304740.1 deoxyhypusine synthase [Candidatus Jingweiarchaeum tengchongense]MCW1309724.1 deoxyhypusine synthase [Candidatus Jingweiarchaeum tengchongense]